MAGNYISNLDRTYVSKIYITGANNSCLFQGSQNVSCAQLQITFDGTQPAATDSVGSGIVSCTSWYKLSPSFPPKYGSFSCLQFSYFDLQATPVEHFCFYCFMETAISGSETTPLGIDLQEFVLPTKNDGLISQDFSSYYNDKVGFGYPTINTGSDPEQVLIGTTTVNITSTTNSLIVNGGGNQLIFKVATGTPLPKAAWVHIYVDNTGQTGNLSFDFVSLSFSYGCFFEATSIARTACKAFTLGATYFAF